MAEDVAVGVIRAEVIRVAAILGDATLVAVIPVVDTRAEVIPAAEEVEDTQVVEAEEAEAAAAIRARTESRSCSRSRNRRVGASLRFQSTNPSMISTRPLARNCAISTTWASRLSMQTQRTAITELLSPLARRT